MTRFVPAVVLAACAAAQVRISGERIAGLPPENWPLGDGGPATEAALTPTALAFDRDGSILIADSYNARLRRLSPSGQISTVFPYSKYGLTNVIAIAFDPQGNLYLSDARAPTPGQLLKIAPDGSVTAVTDVKTSNFPPTVAFDLTGTMYITDFDANVVWKKPPGGALQRIAGSGKIGTDGEGGPALQASLLGPRRIAFDRSGNVLFTDAQRLLRINPNGTLDRLTGGGLMDLEPSGIAASPDGRIYIASLQYRIWRWDPGGETTIFAGTGVPAFSDGCDGSAGAPRASTAALSASDVLLDSAGRLYIADSWNKRVRRIDPDGSIRTVAGTGPRPPLDDVLQIPGAIAAGVSGNVYFTEPTANRVRQITPDGRLLVVIGKNSPPPDQDPACFTLSGDILRNPQGLAVDRKDNVYVADAGNNRILRRSSQGVITTVAAGLKQVASLAVDSNDELWFSEDNQIRHLLANGTVVTPPVPFGQIAAGLDGRLLILNSGLFVAQPGGPFERIAAEMFGTPALDPFGSIFLTTGSQLSRITPNCGRVFYDWNWNARAMAFDAAGNLYVADENVIRRIAPLALPAPDVPSPFILPLGVRNAASNLVATETLPSQGPFRPPITITKLDSIAAGEILRITGTCLGPLSSNTSGVEVLFDGVPGKIFSAQSSEVVAQVAQSVAGKTSTSLVVRYQGSPSVETLLKVERDVPGVFLIQGSQAAALNQDGSINGTGRPAGPGSILSIFLTGAEGMTSAQVSVGGFSATVVYAGDAPGLAGVQQINFVVPLTPLGAASLKVSIDGATRNQSVTVVTGSRSFLPPVRRR